MSKDIFTLHYATLHYTTLHYTTLHYITVCHTLTLINPLRFFRYTLCSPRRYTIDQIHTVYMSEVSEWVSGNYNPKTGTSMNSRVASWNPPGMRPMLQPVFIILTILSLAQDSQPVHLSHTHTHTHTHTHMHMHRHTHTYTDIHRHTQTYTHTHSHTYTHIHTHAHTCTHIHTHAHTCTHIHTHTQTYTDIHIHIHIHIHTSSELYVLIKYAVQVSKWVSDICTHKICCVSE
jgi:hypothetical protein